MQHDLQVAPHGQEGAALAGGATPCTRGAPHMMATLALTARLADPLRSPSRRSCVGWRAPVGSSACARACAADRQVIASATSHSLASPGTSWAAATSGGFLAWSILNAWMPLFSKRPKLANQDCNVVVAHAALRIVGHRPMLSWRACWLSLSARSRSRRGIPGGRRCIAGGGTSSHTACGRRCGAVEA